MPTERDVTTSNDSFVINKASDTMTTGIVPQKCELAVPKPQSLHHAEKAVFMHIMRTKTSVTHNQLCTQQWRQALQIPSYPSNNQQPEQWSE